MRTLILATVLFSILFSCSSGDSFPTTYTYKEIVINSSRVVEIDATGNVRDLSKESTEIYQLGLDNIIQEAQATILDPLVIEKVEFLSEMEAIFTLNFDGEISTAQVDLSDGTEEAQYFNESFMVDHDEGRLEFCVVARIISNGTNQIVSFGEGCMSEEEVIQERVDSAFRPSIDTMPFYMLGVIYEN